MRGPDRFFTTNFRALQPIKSPQTRVATGPIMWSSIGMMARNSRPTLSMLNNFRGTSRGMATHRDLGLRSNGSYGFGNRRGFSWSAYQGPILFSAGVIVFNAVVLPLLFRVPLWSRTFRMHPEYIVYGIFAINLAVFAGWHLAKGRALQKVMKYGLLRKDEGFNNWQMLGSAFSHMSFGHFAINMFVLFNMGLPMAKMLGAAKFLEVYLDGAIASSLLSVVAPAFLGNAAAVPSLGASGALFTVFGLLATLVPNTHFGFLGLPIPMSGQNVFLTSMGVNAAGLFYRWGAIDYAGHLGGSVAAVIWAYILIRKARESRRNRRLF